MDCLPTETLAERVLAACRRQGITLSCAESCTGGLIAAALTDVPGSSDVFMGGVVSYWADVKARALGVSPQTIESKGVVSEEVAGEMAQGSRRAIGSDIAVATTGIAGPGGAEPGKPVGTVCYAVAGPRGVKTLTVCAGTSRAEVRALAVERALEMLLEYFS